MNKPSEQLVREWEEASKDKNVEVRSGYRVNPFKLAQFAIAWARSQAEPAELTNEQTEPASQIFECQACCRIGTRAELEGTDERECDCRMHMVIADEDTLRAALAKPVEPAIVWPKARDVGRYGDMSQSANLQIGFDSDNDVCVSVWDDRGGARVEFCNGGGGGGRSPRTRLALIALMVAMEAENAATPALDWWAVRSGAAAKGGAL